MVQLRYYAVHSCQIKSVIDYKLSIADSVTFIIGKIPSIHKQTGSWNFILELELNKIFNELGTYMYHSTTKVLGWETNARPHPPNLLESNNRFEMQY